MKHLFFAFISLIPFVNLSGQLFLTPEQENKLIQFYESGTQELEKGNYMKADSLLSLSVKIKANSDNLFNRGIAKLNLQDTCSYCDDMYQASRLMDDQADKLFNEFCQKLDTFYFDKDFVLTNRNNHKYYEVQKIHKYSHDTIVEVRSLKENPIKYSSYLDNSGLKRGHFDLLAIYKIINNEERYIVLNDKPQFNIYDKSLYDYINENINIPANIRKGIIINFMVTLEGKIRIINITPIDLANEYKIKIAQVLYRLPINKPARFLGKQVNFEYSLQLY